MPETHDSVHGSEPCIFCGYRATSVRGALKHLWDHLNGNVDAPGGDLDG